MVDSRLRRWISKGEHLHRVQKEKVQVDQPIGFFNQAKDKKYAKYGKTSNLGAVA